MTCLWDRKTLCKYVQCNPSCVCHLPGLLYIFIIHISDIVGQWGGRKSLGISLLPKESCFTAFSPLLRKEFVTRPSLQPPESHFLRKPSLHSFGRSRAFPHFLHSFGRSSGSPKMRHLLDTRVHKKWISDSFNITESVKLSRRRWGKDGLAERYRPLHSTAGAATGFSAESCNNQIRL